MFYPNCTDVTNVTDFPRRLVAKNVKSVEKMKLPNPDQLVKYDQMSACVASSSGPNKIDDVQQHSFSGSQPCFFVGVYK